MFKRNGNQKRKRVNKTKEKGFLITKKKNSIKREDLVDSEIEEKSHIMYKFS